VGIISAYIAKKTKYFCFSKESRVVCCGLYPGTADHVQKHRENFVPHIEHWQNNQTASRFIEYWHEKIERGKSNSGYYDVRSAQFDLGAGLALVYWDDKFIKIFLKNETK